MTIAFVGIGSNLEDPQRQVTQAFEALDRLAHSRVVRKSSLYRSAPLGHAEQADFVNAVAQLETGLPAARLLAELQAIETLHGRARSFPNAPRTLDLDLLLYGDRQMLEKDLVLPHPRMHERAFVLRPLLEIAPEATIPGRGPAKALLAACAAQRVERIA